MAKRTAKAVTHGPSKAKKSKQSKASKKPPSSQSLLSLMNNNIRITKRVRRTHAKFAALNLNPNGEEGDWALSAPPILGEEEIDDVIDDRPWQARAAGIELGEESATDCLQWMSRKVLEHVGFQGR
jgi:transcriptional activator SPT7